MTPECAAAYTSADAPVAAAATASFFALKELLDFFCASGGLERIICTVDAELLAVTLEPGDPPFSEPTSSECIILSMC